MEELKFKPTHYKLHFIPDLKNSVFYVEEEIQVNIEKEIKTILFDALELEISSVNIFSKHKEKIKNSFKVDNKNHKLSIVLESIISPGEYLVKLEFSAKYTETLAGWYKSKVIGRNEYIFSSQFEAADARRAFVCIDNPSCKTTFSVSMEVGKDLLAISNMPVIKEVELLNDKKLVTFSPTHKMSTYLLYLGLGNFEYIKDNYKHIVLRGIATPGKAKYMKQSLQFTKQALKYFEDYFGVPYPLPKLDLIAVPDFAQGAMENWGAITFREESVLVYEGKTPIVNKKWIAVTVMHEIAHQWFGNLVTMKWWDNLWLNESFATFMEGKAIAYYYPEWETDIENISSRTFIAMGLDSLKSSHAIQNNAKDLASIEQNFDLITYEKGASILRMLEGYVGENALREGLKSYIKQFAYSNARAENLWEAIAKASEKPIRKIMNDFVKKTGYPQVHVEKLKDKLLLTQKRFTYLPNNDETLWPIPLFLKNKKNFLLEKRNAFLDSSIGEPPIINNNYLGFFITLFEPSLLEEILVDKRLLTIYDRLGILHDVFATIMATETTLSTYLIFVENFLDKETDPDVLLLGLSQLRRVYILLEQDDIAKQVSSLAKHILRQVGNIPKSGENTRIPLLRSSSLYALGIMGDPDVISFADSLLHDLANGKEIHPDIRPVTYSIAIRANVKHHSFLKSRYQSLTADAEKTEILSALGFAKEKELIEDTLVFALSPEVRYANLLFFSRPFSSNPQIKEFAFPWLKKNWQTLIKQSGGVGENILQHLIKSIVPNGISLYKEDILEFLDILKGGVLGKAARETEEEIQIITNFVEKNK